MHPHHDATYRSLAIAKTYYPLVFGAASVIGDGVDHHEPAHSGSNILAGTLYRVGVGQPSSLSEFQTEVADMVGTAITPLNFDYREVYKARDGTLVIDGTDQAEQIAVNADGSVTYVRNGATINVTGHQNSPAYTDGIPATVAVNVRTAGGNDTVTVNLGVGAVLDGGLGDDTLTGSSVADQIFGFDGNDSLSGLGGGDVLDGGAGADTLLGGDQSDTMLGGTRNDSIFGGSGNDSASGQGGNDSIYGEGGSDTLGGDAGNDRIDGGLQNDTLIGGSGIDTYFAAGDSAAVDSVAFDNVEDIWGSRDNNEILI